MEYFHISASFIACIQFYMIVAIYGYTQYISCSPVSLIMIGFFALVTVFTSNAAFFLIMVLKYYLFRSMHGVFFTSYSTTLPSDYMNRSINSAGVIISGLSTSISEKSLSPVTRTSTSSMIAVYSTG